MPGRTDSGSRIILAPPPRIYRALLDPTAVVRWRPPTGMRAEIHAFDPCVGGAFRMTMVYCGVGRRGRGKTTERSDVIRGRFLELVPDTLVVEVVEFETDDTAFAGGMRVTTALAAVEDGTEVTIRCDDVPSGIRPEEHAAGLKSTLAKLAALTE